LLAGFGFGLAWVLDLARARGLTTALVRSFDLSGGVFLLIGTTLSVVWNNSGYRGSVYALRPA